MIHGLKHLLDLRKQGKRPAFLMIDVGGEYLPIKYEAELDNMRLMAEGSLNGDDFRAFVGLDVLIYSPKASKTYIDLIERLKPYASKLTVTCGEYGADLGWEWSQKWGDCEFGETAWAEQWDEARKTGCSNKAETAARAALEREALAHCPWINERLKRGPISA